MKKFAMFAQYTTAQNRNLMSVEKMDLLLPTGERAVGGASGNNAKEERVYMTRFNTRAEREVDHGRCLARAFTEKIWGWGTPAGRLRAARRAALVATGARLAPGVRALEIGCGTGTFTQVFASTGAELVAIDISPELLDKARRGTCDMGNVRLLNKSYEDCGLGGPFDAVIGSSVLHHLDLHIALRTIYDLLKPHGRLSFAEPNLINPQIFVERMFRRFFPYVSPDETAFVRWRLKCALEGAGFIHVTIEPFDWLHPSISAKAIGFVSALGIWFERVPLLREFAGSLYINAIRPPGRLSENCHFEPMGRNPA
jgi:2-polyprenyl-3-methyl-5-hydroxy-6-metoxy-1,4-benzoquinol methylase